MSYDIIQRSRDSEFIELSCCKNIDVDSHKEYSIDDSLHSVRGGMDGFQLPEPLPLQGNLADNWRRWKQRFELYMIASGKNEKSEEVKTATLLHLAGPDALEVYNTSFESPGDEKKLQKSWKNLMPIVSHERTSRGSGTCSTQESNSLGKL